MMLSVMEMLLVLLWSFLLDLKLFLMLRTEWEVRGNQVYFERAALRMDLLVGSVLTSL